MIVEALIVAGIVADILHIAETVDESVVDMALAALIALAASRTWMDMDN